MFAVGDTIRLSTNICYFLQYIIILYHQNFLTIHYSLFIYFNYLCKEFGNEALKMPCVRESGEKPELFLQL